MIDTKLRKYVQPVFNQVGKGFVRLKMTPNMITVMAFIIGVSAGVFIAFGHIVIPIVLLWTSGLLDVVDGTVARLTNKHSKIGAYLDLIFDRMVEAAIILGFYFLFKEYALAYLLFFISVIFNFTTFLVAASLFKNEGEKSVHYDIGIAERTETFIVFTLMMVFSQHVFIILMVFNVIIFLTGILRFIRTIRYASKLNKQVQLHEA
ncbi:CDP-alcohol phosphatidyltransferase family protein [Peloplasma aerotolerans]|uniref:CDP-alcohol phosphatidyltransferase family protein n=1 Tax=Peloplasma aerotolerans TaxID=3044389 RepID=A0AAW6UBN9_9MOLU|nr:CDP-alcohol phosphatidyltransferase family protein [Mariniplasma sp. M4Ah]MDI6453054.1 CDP-alcohol phosphatidyltransferase family protein [Mariniplasma sp. M4Ah]